MATGMSKLTCMLQDTGLIARAAGFRTPGELHENPWKYRTRAELSTRVVKLDGERARYGVDGSGSGEAC